MQQQDPRPWERYAQHTPRQDAPGVVPGIPDQPDPLQQERIRMDRERIQMQREREQRSADVDEGLTGRPTGEEAKNAGFLIRALSANDFFVDSGVGSRNILAQSFQESFPNAANTFINGSPEQQALAAQNAFVEAVLRSDSGAAIPADEITSGRARFFPMPGESEEVAAQKAQARQDAIMGVYARAGVRGNDALALYRASRSGNYEDVAEQYRPIFEVLNADDSEFGGGLQQTFAQPQSPDLSNVQTAGPTPTGQDYYPQGIEFGMDTWGRDDPFDAARYLADEYGISPEDERQLQGQLNAISGNPQLTSDDVRAVYGRLDIPLPTDADLEELTNNLRTGRVSGIDTSEAEEAYRRSLEQFNEGRAAGDYGAGSLALQGAAFGLGDELEGVTQAVGALATGGDPAMAYQVNRDSVRLGLEQARENTGALGTAAEIGGSLLTGGIRAAPVAMRATAPVRAAGREGAILGGVAGFGYGEGATNSTANALIGAAGGSVLGAGAQRGVQAIAPRVRNAVGMNRRPDASEVMSVVQAGERRGVQVRRADVDPSVRGTRGAALQGRGGERIRAAEQDDLRALEESFLRDVGGSGTANTTLAGDTIQAGVRGARERTRRQAGRLYERADQLTSHMQIQPQRALREVDRQIAELEELGAGQNSAGINYLREVRSDMARDGGLSVAALRGQRTGLRGNLNERNLSATDLERRIGRVLDAAGEDIAQAIGRNSAAGRTFAKADGLWRRQAEFSQQIGDRLLGRNAANPASPTDAANRVLGFAAKDPARLSRLMDEVDEATQTEIRALVAGSLGRKTNGEFQLGAFLRETSPGKGGRLDARSARALFGADGVRALSDLRTLARAKTDAAAQTNFSNTGGVVQRAVNNFRTMMLGAIGIADSGATGGVTMGAGGWLIGRLGEERATRMLLNPDFTKWLRSLPNSSAPRAIDTAFDRLRRVASRNTVFAADANALERALANAANDNAAGRLAAEDQVAEE